MTQHERLNQWIEQIETLCQPDSIRVCDGSQEEYAEMMGLLEKAGVAKPLNPDLRPNSYLVRSDPADVARVESRTFICSDSLEEAGPTNNWSEPNQMRETLSGLFEGCMRGRTMFVIPSVSYTHLTLPTTPYV